MPRYRKKPVEIEAVQLTADNYAEVAEWCAGQYTLTATLIDPATYLHPVCSVDVPTLEGVMRANVGDWIIKEPFPTGDRRFYPCKPDIFTATYEPAEAEGAS